MDEKELTVGEVSLPEEAYNDDYWDAADGVLWNCSVSGLINGPDGTYERVMSVQYQAVKLTFVKCPNIMTWMQ